MSAFLPDGLPGQVHSSGSSGTAAGEPFSLFSVPIASQRKQTAGRQQQSALQPRFDDSYASAEQQVLMLFAIPMWRTWPCVSANGGSRPNLAASAEHLLMVILAPSMLVVLVLA